MARSFLVLIQQPLPLRCEFNAEAIAGVDNGCKAEGWPSGLFCDGEKDCLQKWNPWPAPLSFLPCTCFSAPPSISLSVEGLLFSANNADSMQVASACSGLEGLCGTRGSALISPCPSTGLLQRGRIYGYTTVHSSRWMSLTTLFRTKRSPQERKPLGGPCAFHNLARGNCSHCLSLRQWGRMKLSPDVSGSVLVDGCTAEHKLKTGYVCVQWASSPHQRAIYLVVPISCRVDTLVPNPLILTVTESLGSHWGRGETHRAPLMSCHVTPLQTASCV